MRVLASSRVGLKRRRRSSHRRFRRLVAEHLENRFLLTVDASPPSVYFADPSLSTGTLPAETASLTIQFSEPVTNAEGNVSLQRQGTDGLLGTADDVFVPLTLTVDGTKVEMAFDPLVEGVYRLRATEELTDLAGNGLNGVGNSAVSR